MRNKYFILVLTFLSLLIGQSGYAQDWQDFDDDFGWDYSNDDFGFGSSFDDYWNNDFGADVNGGTLNNVTVPNNYHAPIYSGLLDPYNYTNQEPSYDFDEPQEDPPVTSSEDPTTEEPKPDSGCEQEIADKLKSITQSGFKEILNKFSGSNSLYKVNITTGSLGNNPALAQTTNSVTYRTYNITLNENYSNATSLSVATSIVHEYIHAYFKTLYDDYFNNHNTHAFDDTPILSEFYVANTYQGNSEDAQHAQIAASFIDLMAATIQEFQTGIPVTVGAADQFYKDMAWGSLQGTPIYNSDILSQADKDRIGSLRAAETYNEQRGANTPKGTPCNK